jgi:hypothetical protein
MVAKHSGFPGVYLMYAPQEKSTITCWEKIQLEESEFNLLKKFEKFLSYRRRRCFSGGLRGFQSVIEKYSG